MHSIHPLDALALARDRAHGLHAEAAAERLRGGSHLRTLIAASLRRTADRLDGAPLPPRPASQC